MGEAGDCSDMLHELYVFLDGELTVERRRAIQYHLDKCPPCYQAYDFESELRVVISQKCRDEVPESLRHRIFKVIEQTDL